jgi:hypothetical protein
MAEIDLKNGCPADLTPEMIRAQLQLLTRDEIFRASKRSIEFLKFVVEETLKGSEDQIKERTIGMEVFGRSSSYDTNLDHVVRTAATELRKRLAIYYGDEKHRAELRISLLPGSYIPRFMHAHQATQGAAEDGVFTNHHPVPGQTQHFALESDADPHYELLSESNRKAHRRRNRHVAYLLFATILVAGSCGWFWLHTETPEYLFWKPVLDTPGPVLLAVGDVPHGPPLPVAADENQNTPLAIPQSDSSRSVPFADAVTIAKVVGVLESNGKKVLIRRENASSFSDLREGPVVLIGAFNNEWSLRLTRQLRFTLALDTENHLIYIKDGKNPSSRTWSWGTNQPLDHVGEAGGPVLHDYALISRIRNSETGHVLVVIGGLYTYGTQSAGEFLTDPQLMQSIGEAARLGAGNQNLQIVLGTTVTDGTPGLPRVLAISQE